jgi:predicted enzyme related to lactoylglutathione lyase
MPPSWGTYITVDDVDATAAKAKELGGTVLVEPQDIPEVGRFCVIKDPQGAVFSAMTYTS